MKQNTKILIGVLAGLGFIAIMAIFWYVGTYNSIVSLDTQADEAWSNVEAQYQRRVDLIPNLVETVKGYATQEQEVFTEVTKLRSQWASASTQEEQIEAASGLEAAIGKLLLVQESYPELKSNQNFLALQDELAGTENRVAVARNRYNEAASAYNRKIRQIPANIVAGFGGFTEKEFFQADQGAQDVPKVEFG